MHSSQFNLDISTASTRMSKAWRYEKWPWDHFCERCKDFKVTGETVAEYASWDRDRQGRVKDVGGFVCGQIVGGQRTKRNVAMRSAVTLDFDNIDADWSVFIAKVAAVMGDHAYACYTTHKHADTKPRARLVVPTSQCMAVDAYEPVARALCAKVGIDWADSTTYAAERLMYWPSCSTDGDRHAVCQGGEVATIQWIMEGSGVVGKDPATWPRGKDESADTLSASAHRQACGEGKCPDPTAKSGIVGAFCRAHWPLSEALEELLPGVYMPTRQRGRYTYSGGSTSGGAIIYPDSDKTKEDCYLWSQHDTDPAKGMHNIYDLCRIHLFGDLDLHAKHDTATDRLPSYKRMEAFARDDEKTQALIIKECAVAFAGFSEPAADGEISGEEKPEAPKKPKSSSLGSARLSNTIAGAQAAIELMLPGLWLDEVSGRPMVDGDLPWRKAPKEGAPHPWTDLDESNLRAALESLGITGKERVRDGLDVVLMRRRRDPLKDWLLSLRWDGNPRIEGGTGADGIRRRPMLTRWLGAADNDINKAMAKAFMVGLVRRALEPGCQHDYTLALQGPEGIGKSTLCAMLGGQWYVTGVLAIDNKDALLALQGAWVVEFGEIAALKRSDVAVVKDFLTRRCDEVRRPYERITQKSPRRCAFIATTNEASFLCGEDGNRRFFVVECGLEERDPLENFADERDQIVAEAVALYRQGERNWLSAEMEEKSRELQKRHNADAEDPIPGMLDAFLEKPVPFGWESWETERRRRYANGQDGTDYAKSPRSQFVAAEFLIEALRYNEKDGRFRKMVMKVNSIMAGKEEWEKAAIRSPYGFTRGWRRVGGGPNPDTLDTADLI